MTFRTSLLALAAIVVALARAGADSKPAPSPPPPPGQVPAPPKAKDVEAGPIFDQAEAEQKCPTVCKPPTKWNGSWRTVKAQMMSVCGCAEPAPPPPPPPPAPPLAVKTTDLEAGPLVNQDAANARCPQVCKAPATWNGVWRTTKPGVMSVCTCQQPLVKTVETSSIKSSADAKTKCTKACAPMLWTGDWKKQSKKKATCDCAEPPPPPIAPPPPPPVAPRK